MEDMLSHIGKKIGEGRQEDLEVAILERIIDSKKCIGPHFKYKDDSLVGHKNPHYFNFNLKNGKPMMQWKYYSIDGDDLWSKPYALLQKAPSLKNASLLSCQTNHLMMMK